MKRQRFAHKSGTAHELRRLSELSVIIYLKRTLLRRRPAPPAAEASFSDSSFPNAVCRSFTRVPSARAQLPQREPQAEPRPPATLHRARPPAATRCQGGARREAHEPSAAPVPLPARGGGGAGRDPRAAASAGQGRPAGAGRRRAPPRALPRLPARRPGRRLLRRGRAGGAAPKFAERPAPRPCGCCGCCWARRVSAGAGRPGALPGGEGACSARRRRARGLASAPASRRRPASRGASGLLSSLLFSPPLRFPTSGRAEAAGAARGGAVQPSRPPLGAGPGWGRPAGG